ncbi:MAG: aminotransferase class V-fold PLP-dependent enzyme, partial [Collinsella sp.]|nr:aminotransferase class V-fold PLP-dependent enzyme [Collinsella sp.]
MIYLDNAATTMHKPQTVIDAVTQAMCSLGNAGRGATSGALDAARAIHGCRTKLARFLGCPRADHVCFTPNSTAALNTVINGVVRPGDRVVTTVLEHNSVLRPLNRLAVEQGVTVEYAGCDANGVLDYDELEQLVTPGTRAVVVTHASNVTGNSVDVARVAAVAHAAGALVIVDASQSAGTAKIDMDTMGLDVVCFTGHKGLMGPQGTGGLAVAEGIDVAPWAMGGTGVRSFDALQPLEWPTRLEAGTLNGHGIAGLSAGLDFIEAQGGVE